VARRLKQSAQSHPESECSEAATDSPATPAEVGRSQGATSQRRKGTKEITTTTVIGSSSGGGGGGGGGVKTPCEGWGWGGTGKGSWVKPCGLFRGLCG
jgi:hypothetical protein